ncbi:energy-coupling factor transport system ATP-binding protein [Austwickia chelonae]|uniref:Putative ABC transporter ATP-binding protein n=1 Tax=Austwickia chelonae NBRC 105200 TaxID=1184607 RepID=K6VUF5_9MICO|nr:ABC transporter ATP-binding protein [Austwickia chelonae]GAB78970.1 putative ABC transporter ATP-binding protein [Austwickia chelonae NBRC 105200]SEV87538.1 energy-coupling factor transport system ATP-binding protein [Austwickia chelonae]
MSAIDFTGTTFAYRIGHEDSPAPGQTGSTVPGVTDLTLTLEPGTATLLTGPSGCGKSTVLRLANGLIPHVTGGDLDGTVRVEGIDVAGADVYRIGSRTGTVFQNPRNQFFAATVGEELAFARQQAGEPRDQIEAAVASAAHRVGIQTWLERSLWELSGGELQAVACASALAGPGRIYLFDEPTANLSVRAIDELARIMAEMKRDGATLLIAEHRLYYLRELVDTVVTMENGRLTGTWAAEEFFRCTDEQRRKAGWRTLQPPTMTTGGTPDAQTGTDRPRTETDPTRRGADIRLVDVRFSYGDRCVLSLPELCFPAGTVTALTGDNGAGKSTLCRLLTGLAQPTRGGRIEIDGVGTSAGQRRQMSSLVMQDVHRQLFAESVLAEVTTGLSSVDAADAAALLGSLDLADLLDRHPMSLSGGQKQRLMIAVAMASQARIVVFDEPTSGVDYRHMQAIGELIRSLAARGVTVLVVTHDVEFLEVCADRVVRLGRPAQSGRSSVEISER